VEIPAVVMRVRIGMLRLISVNKFDAWNIGTGYFQSH